jgi:predicted O-methyltransferase YrrM
LIEVIATVGVERRHSTDGGRKRVEGRSGDERILFGDKRRETLVKIVRGSAGRPQHATIVAQTAILGRQMQPLPHFVLWLLGLRSPETQTTARERAALSRLAAGQRRVVEIGVWHGVTTSVLRRSMASDGVLWAVDPFPPGRLLVSLQRPIARREVRRVRKGAVRWLRETGEQAAATYTRSGEPAVDLVFIDGDHSYEGLVSDWRAWSPLVAAGGVVALHDSRPTPERPIADAGSVRATSEIVLKDSRFELVEEVDSLTVVQRRQRV